MNLNEEMMKENLNYDKSISEDEKSMLLQIYSNMLESAKEQDKNIHDKNLNISQDDYNELLL